MGWSATVSRPSPTPQAAIRRLLRVPGTGRGNLPLVCSVHAPTRSSSSNSPNRWQPPRAGGASGPRSAMCRCAERAAWLREASAPEATRRGTTRRVGDRAGTEPRRGPTHRTARCRPPTGRHARGPWTALRPGTLGVRLGGCGRSAPVRPVGPSGLGSTASCQPRGASRSAHSGRSGARGGTRASRGVGRHARRSCPRPSRASHAEVLVGPHRAGWRQQRRAALRGGVSREKIGRRQGYSSIIGACPDSGARRRV